MTVQSFLNGRDALNHVLNLQRFSLANYLRFARPWTREADCKLLATVFDIAEVQMQNATRIGGLLVERHASIEPGSFPTRFIGLNDLSIEHAALRVAEDLDWIIRNLQSCEDVLGDDAAAWELVQGMLRDEKRNINMLRKDFYPPLGNSGHFREVRYIRRGRRGTWPLSTIRSDCSVRRPARVPFVPYIDAMVR